MNIRDIPRFQQITEIVQDDNAQSNLARAITFMIDAALLSQQGRSDEAAEFLTMSLWAWQNALWRVEALWEREQEQEAEEHNRALAEGYSVAMENVR